MRAPRRSAAPSRRVASAALLAVAGVAAGCTATATQTLGTGTPGRFPRSTEVALDLRPGGIFTGTELVIEEAPGNLSVRGGHLRGGYAFEPRLGSGEIWTFDLGATAGIGRPPFELEETTTFAAGAFSDLALRIVGGAEEPGRLELTRFTLHLVFGGRARMWPAAEPAQGEVAAAMGLRFGFDTDARSIVDKALEETANAFGL